MTRRKLCLAFIIYITLVAAMGIGSMIVLFNITSPSRDGIPQSNKSGEQQ